MIGAHRAFLVSLIGFAVGGIAYAQQTEMQTLMLGHVSLYKTDQSFTQVIIGDPKIVDVNATSDRTATMTALMTGATNVVFVNARGEPISEFEVVVSEPTQSRVKVHNKSSGLTGYSSYRCGPTFCDLIDETISKEPAPTRPTSSRSVTTNSDGTSSVTTTQQRQ
jgi:Flp pilus assembly secretin CpaC